jgi:hypothetical protein
MVLQLIEPEGVDWNDLAQEREMLHDLLKTVMKLWILQNADN